MKYLQQKDLKRRTLFSRNETRYLALKALAYSKQFRGGFISTKLLLNSRNNFSKVSIKNVCVLTNRQKSVDRFTRLSRIKFRERASDGKIFGISKASW